MAMGARPGQPYAWQTKMPSVAHLLTSIAPVLERRLEGSPFCRFSGRLRLNFYKFGLDLNWHDGRLESVASAAEEQGDHTLSLPPDLFPSICLGHRSWRELRHIRPDISPASAESALFVETIFPPTNSWIHEQY
jgi:hypothetical protein